jgi:glucosyl-dolichyl phosphate glucuronosyltransferase
VYELASMRLSVVIPTHNRAESLRRCLQTLQSQDLDPAELEVVVVDDGSDVDMGGVVGELAAGPVHMHCERQKLTGLNGARNRGAVVTRGELMAFLDDDTLVAPGWARALLSAFDHYPCAAVAGKIELALAGPAPSWLAAHAHWLAEYDRGPDARWLEADDPLPVGANCAVRRSDFERIGGFHLGLDRVAGSLVSNGDTEFFHRLRAAGGRFRYEPGAHVMHCVPADRLTVDYFLKRHRAQGVSDELLFALQGGQPTIGYRVFLARSIAGVGATFCRDLLRGRGTLDARFWASYWRGRLSAIGKAPPAVGSPPASDDERAPLEAAG